MAWPSEPIVVQPVPLASPPNAAPTVKFVFGENASVSPTSGGSLPPKVTGQLFPKG